MAIKIIEEPDVYLTQDERDRLHTQYQQDYLCFSGTPPSFETYCRRKKAQSQAGKGGES